MIQFQSILKNELSEFLSIRKISKSKSRYNHDKHTLKLFDDYLVNTNCTQKNLTEDQMTDWVKTLNGKSNTIADKVVVIRLFLNSLISKGINPYIPPIPKVRDDYIPYIFSDEEIDKIFMDADMMLRGRPVKNIFIHAEMPMILRIMYGCGLRIGETLLLQVKDINFSIGVLTLKHTKRNKQRIIPIHSTLTEIIRKYCLSMDIHRDLNAYLFPTINSNVPITVSAARHRFESILKNIQITYSGREKHQRGPCLHCLRHVFVFKSFIKFEEKGMQINEAVPYLSLYLGHYSLKETEKYLKFSSELFPQAAEMFETFTENIFPEVKGYD